MFVLPVTRSARRAVPAYSLAVDRLLGESLHRYFGDAVASNESRSPNIDVLETDSQYTIVLDVPGVAKDQLKVSVEGRRVSVSTTDAAPADGKDERRVLYRERAVPRYARTVSLPAEVNHEASEARFENGVLTLTLAKKLPAGATRLKIN